MNPTTPDLPESGTPNLRRAVAALPPHEPDPASWPAIAAQLAADEALARALPALPVHAPADDLWASISARLDAGEATAPAPAAAIAPAVVRTLPPAGRLAWLSRPARRALALAASLLLVLGVAWWGQRLARPAPAGLRETVAYSEEISTDQPATPAVLAAPAFDPLQRQGVAFIDSRCSARPVVCGSGEFRALRTQLAEVAAEQAQLQQDARRFGESPELLREQTRLITLQASLTRELVQLLIS